MTTPTNRSRIPRRRVDPQRVGAVSAGERRRRPAWLFGLLALLALALLALLLFLLLRHHGHKHTAVVPPAAAAAMQLEDRVEVRLSGASPTASSTPTAVATSAGTTGTGGTGTGGTGTGGISVGGVGGAALIGGGGVAAQPLTGTGAGSGSGSGAGSGSGTSTGSPAPEGTVLFASGSAALDAQSRQVIAAAAARIKAQHSTKVSVTGYTDVVGGQPVNGDLSQQRADAVAAALRSDLGADTPTISTASRGQADPVASNSTAAGRQQNRRATITGS